MDGGFPHPFNTLLPSSPISTIPNHVHACTFLVNLLNCRHAYILHVHRSCGGIQRNENPPAGHKFSLQVISVYIIELTSCAMCALGAATRHPDMGVGEGSQWHRTRSNFTTERSEGSILIPVQLAAVVRGHPNCPPIWRERGACALSAIPRRDNCWHDGMAGARRPCKYIFVLHSLRRRNKDWFSQ